jgi:hypothetical protein
VGLRAEYKALPGFEVTGSLRLSSIPWSPCPQEQLAAPGVAVGAAVGNEPRENVSGKRAGEGEGRGEYAGGKGDHPALINTVEKAIHWTLTFKYNSFCFARSAETNVKDVKVFRAALSKHDAYDALLAGGMGELLLDDELTPLDNEIEKCGQNAAERIILVYEGKHQGEV